MISTAKTLRNRRRGLLVLLLSFYVVIVAGGLWRIVVAATDSSPHYYVAARELRGGHRLEEADLEFDRLASAQERAIAPPRSSFAGHYLNLPRKLHERISESMLSATPLVDLPSGYVAFTDSIPSELHMAQLVDVGTVVRYCDGTDCGSEEYEVDAIVCGSAPSSCAAIFAVKESAASHLLARIKAGSHLVVESDKASAKK
jgi:hypothetical protein